MDELREERDELAAEADATRDELLAIEAVRRYWTDEAGLEWAQHVSAETARWNV